METYEFNETVYLSMHEDVREAVANGTVPSGEEHYRLFGKAEGRRLSRVTESDLHFMRDYTKLVRELIEAHPRSYDLAMAKAVGSPTLESFVEFGDKQVHILRRIGLQNGQAVYDLGCGAGRTAIALQRHGWQGTYCGADVIDELVKYASGKAPGFQFLIHRDFSIAAPAGSQDIVYAWSLFTHLNLEEIFLYAQDCKRALKPGGLLVFSFLEPANPSHFRIFQNRVSAIASGQGTAHLDTFLERTTIIQLFAKTLGLRLVEFIDGDDASATPLGHFGQSLAVWRKQQV